MVLRYVSLFILIALLKLAFVPGADAATPITGLALTEMPSGQFTSLEMTIDDTKTTFRMTGPDFSWFAFGFDTRTMAGYSLIVEGTDANRIVYEQNLRGNTTPGSPQVTQNASIVSTLHDTANDLTTIVIERLNNTGDTNDPVFSTSMTALDIIAAYDSFSSPDAPSSVLSYHGADGQAFGRITFAAVPEPTTIWLTASPILVGLLARRRSRF